jgi:hypothetical protein
MANPVEDYIAAVSGKQVHTALNCLSEVPQRGTQDLVSVEEADDPVRLVE